MKWLKIQSVILKTVSSSNVMCHLGFPLPFATSTNIHRYVRHFLGTTTHLNEDWLRYVWNTKYLMELNVKIFFLQMQELLSKHDFRISTYV